MLLFGVIMSGSDLDDERFDELTAGGDQVERSITRAAQGPRPRAAHLPIFSCARGAPFVQLSAHAPRGLQGGWPGPSWERVVSGRISGWCRIYLHDKYSPPCPVGLVREPFPHGVRPL